MGHDETTYQGLCSGVEGRSAVKTEPSDPGSSFRGESPAGGLSESALIGKRMVTAAAVAVEETRRRIDLVRGRPREQRHRLGLSKRDVFFFLPTEVTVTRDEALQSRA